MRLDHVCDDLAQDLCRDQCSGLFERVGVDGEEGDAVAGEGAGHARRRAGEMARLYRLALNGRIRSDEMTRFLYALKEIRACLEAELLTDVQQRLALLSRGADAIRSR